MADSKKILLVEGDTDKSFFEEICKQLSLNTLVKVAPPKDLGGKYNSKQGVLNHLEILLPQLNDGQLTHIAVIIDADYIKHGGGEQKTIKQMSNVLESFDFTLYKKTISQKGLLFKHSDGLADFGLWIMSNNNQEGMLEDWIIQCIANDEQALFQHAKMAIEKLSPPKFKPHLQAKAEVATWLAWQKIPGHGLYYVINENLLDKNNEMFTGLTQWLNTVFKDN